MTRDVRKFGISDKRGRALTSEDPYIDKAGMKEPALCRQCHSTYHNKRWVLDPEAFETRAQDEDVSWITCPACQKIAEHYPEGMVTLRGDYLWQHEEEIFNILRNEEAKAMDKNPLERIMRMEREGEALVVETTEEKLAEHLGRAMHRAHHGELNISWDRDHDFCRVTWERRA